MATWLRQSTAVDIALGPFVDSTDGFTPETALSLTQAECRLKKNAGAWAQKNDVTTGVHEEEGWYEIELDSTDTNTLGILIVAVYVAGALPVWREFLVVTAQVWDSYLASDLLQVHAAEISNDLITAASIAASAIGSAEIADGAITAAKIAADAIGASQIAADAIGSSELAATAAAEIADAVWDEAISGHQTAGSTGRNLTLAGSVLGEFTATGVPTTTTVPITGGSAVNDYYNDMALLITSGALIGQIRPILDYDGATGVITVDEPFTSAPAAGVTVSILASHTHPITQIAGFAADAVWDEVASGHVAAGTFGAAIQGLSTLTLAQISGMVVEGSLTLEGVMRIILAATSGKSHSPASGQRAYRDVADTRNRILANVSGGDRTTVTLDPT